MKKILALLAVAAGIGFITPAESSARDHCDFGSRRIVSYHSCGAPVYAVYQSCGYDRWGHPIGHWVTQHVSHSSCGTCYPRHHHHHDHDHDRHSSRGPRLPMLPHHRFIFGR